MAHAGAAEDGGLSRHMALLDVDETDEDSFTEEDARGRPARHFFQTARASRLSPSTSPASPPYLSSSSENEDPSADCGCGNAPTSALFPASPDSEGDEFFSEGEQILLADEFGAVSFGLVKRPSLPLPSLPGAGAPSLPARQTTDRQRSLGSSAFVEERLERRDGSSVRGTSQGGSPEIEGQTGTATATPNMSFQTATTSTARPPPAREQAAGPSSSTRSAPLAADEERSKPAARRVLRKKRPISKKERFERFVLPTEESLQVASECELVGEGGHKVKFGDLIKQRGHKKVIVMCVPV